MLCKHSILIMKVLLIQIVRVRLTFVKVKELMISFSRIIGTQNLDVKKHYESSYLIQTLQTYTEFIILNTLTLSLIT